MTARVDWSAVLTAAARIVDSYDTGVTLRQLFYRLVAAGLIPNTQSAYVTLSSRTAQARREGRFPPLIDRGREIHRYQTWTSPRDALDELVDGYRRDRTEGQPCSVYLGVEKATMTAQLMAWFGDYGFPVVPLGGYSSQTLVDSVKADVSASGRPAVLVYAGDFDPTGEDIDRDFAERTDCFAKVIRVAVLPEQVEEYGLTENPGKESDTRSAGFVARHGRNVQVELEALDPAVIRQLYTDAIVGLWDADAYDAVLAREGSERAALSRLRERLEHS